jgi:hypothetical protein
LKFWFERKKNNKIQLCIVHSCYFWHHIHQQWNNESNKEKTQR